MKQITQYFLEGESPPLSLTWLLSFGYETHLYLYETVTKALLCLLQALKKNFTNSRRIQA